MRRLQGTGQLRPDLYHPLGRQRALDPDQFRQGGCLHQLHHEEDAARMGHHVIEGHHSLMVEPGRRSGLPRHPRLGRVPLRVRHAGRECHLLDRDLAPQDQVVGTPHHPHPASSERDLERIAVDEDAIRFRSCHLVRLPTRTGRNLAVTPNPPPWRTAWTVLGAPKPSVAGVPGCRCPQRGFSRGRPAGRSPGHWKGPGDGPGPVIAGGCGTDQPVRWKVKIPSASLLRRGRPVPHPRRPCTCPSRP